MNIEIARTATKKYYLTSELHEGADRVLSIAKNRIKDEYLIYFVPFSWLSYAPIEGFFLYRENRYG